MILGRSRPGETRAVVKLPILVLPVALLLFTGNKVPLLPALTTTHLTALRNALSTVLRKSPFGACEMA